MFTDHSERLGGSHQNNMPTGNRKYTKTVIKTKQAMSKQENHMKGKMMMTQSQMDKEMRSNIKSKKM